MLMDTLWGKHGAAFITPGAHELRPLPESPCVHMHNATQHNSTNVSMMDIIPSGDEYIRREARRGDMFFFLSFLLFLSTLSSA